MRSGYSLLTGETIAVQFPSSIPPAMPSKKHLLRKHSGVIVKDECGKVLRGTIVSYLPLSEYAVANGYKIIEAGRTYSAADKEVTRLS